MGLQTDENQSNGKRMGEPLEPQDEPGAKRSRQQDTDAPVLQPAPVQPQLTAVSSTGPPQASLYHRMASCMCNNHRGFCTLA